MTQQPDDGNVSLPSGKPRRGFRFYLLIFFLVLIAAHQIFNLIVGLRLKAEFRRIRATGAPVTLAEAAPPKVPDHQNAAPLYLQAYEGLHGWPESQPLDDYIAYLEHPDKMPRPEQSKVSAALAANEDYFNLLEAAARRPVCRFPVAWEDLSLDEEAHLQPVFYLGKLLLVRALVAAQQGYEVKCFQSLAALLAMANQVGQEPTWYAASLRGRMINLVFNKFPVIMAAAPAEAPCRTFYQSLDRAQQALTLRQLLEDGRARGLAAFDYTRQESPFALLYGGRPSGRRPNLITNSWRLFRPFWEPFLKLDELYYLRNMQKAVARDAPYFSIGNKKNYELWEVVGQQAPKYALVTRLLWLPYYAYQYQFGEPQMRLQLMQGALALRIYQINHGQYPATLEELAGQGWEVPKDYFSGQPLHYRRVGDGYLLYSIGPNMKDDGGLTVRERRENRYQALEFHGKDITIVIEK